MKRIKVEFFHDVICSFCFPMSYRMRQVKEQMPDIEIIHRSFALVRSEEDFIYMFGSREKAKVEVVKHWQEANKNDDLHRFNIKGMMEADFPFPTSMNALKAAKAALFVSEEDGYWDMFDQLQLALFVENRNIEEDSVIEDCARKAAIDFDDWKKHYHNSSTKEAVERDLQLVVDYGIRGVPCLIIDEKYKLSGAQPLPQIIEAINAALERHKEIEAGDGLCSIDKDGNVHCG